MNLTFILGEYVAYSQKKKDKECNHCDNYAEYTLRQRKIKNQKSYLCKECLDEILESQARMHGPT